MTRFRLLALGLALFGVAASVATAGHSHAGPAASAHECVTCVHADITGVVVSPAFGTAVAAIAIDVVRSDTPFVAGWHVWRPMGRGPPLPARRPV